MSDILILMDDKETQLPFIKEFRNLWADNADYLSYHYVGTGSTTSSQTRGNSNIQAMFD